MKNLLYSLGLLTAFFCNAQQQKTTVIPASEINSVAYNYSENSGVQNRPTSFTPENFGGQKLQCSEMEWRHLSRFSERFWVWVSFFTTSVGFIGLLIVFNKMKKNFTF